MVYSPGDSVSATSINKAITDSASALAISNSLTQEPDNTDVATAGTPAVTITGIGEDFKFKFSQLKGLTGDTGSQGIQGDTGLTGDTGATPAITVGIVETLDPTENVTVTMTGTDENPILNIGIPQGDKGIEGMQGIPGITGEAGITGDTGITPAITVGTVETLDPTENVTVTMTGTDENPILNIGIPQGEPGESIPLTGGSNGDVLVKDDSEQSGTSWEDKSPVTNLTTNDDNKSLAASQGVALKSQIDAIEELNTLSALNADGNPVTIPNADGSYVDKLGLDIVGKNKININGYSATLNGVTITIVNNKITLNGTCTTSVSVDLTSGDFDDFSSINSPPSALYSSEIFASKDYSLSIQDKIGGYSTSGTNGAINLYNTSGTRSYVSFSEIESGSSGDVSISSNIGMIALYLNEDNVYDNVEFYIQLEEGSTATPYKPYLEDITQTTIKSEGKNLFDGEMTIGYSSTITGELLTTHPSRIATVNFIPIMGFSNIVISKYVGTGGFGRVFYYDKDYTYLSKTATQIWGAENAITYAVIANAAYIKFYDDSQITYDYNVGSYYQVESGTSATTYEPYHTPTTKLIEFKDTTNTSVELNSGDKIFYSEDLGHHIIEQAGVNIIPSIETRTQLSEIQTFSGTTILSTEDDIDIDVVEFSAKGMTPKYRLLQDENNDLLVPYTEADMVFVKKYGKFLNQILQERNSRLDELDANKQDNLEYDTVPTTGSENVVTSGGVYTAINNIVSIEFDSVPTTASDNLVNSGGIKTALDLKAPLANPTFTGTITIAGTDNIVVPIATVDGEAVNKGQMDTAIALKTGIVYVTGTNNATTDRANLTAAFANNTTLKLVGTFNISGSSAVSCTNKTNMVIDGANAKITGTMTGNVYALKFQDCENVRLLNLNTEITGYGFLHCEYDDSSTGPYFIENCNFKNTVRYRNMYLHSVIVFINNCRITVAGTPTGLADNIYSDYGSVKLTNSELNTPITTYTVSNISGSDAQISNNSCFNGSVYVTKGTVVGNLMQSSRVENRSISVSSSGIQYANIQLA